MADQLLAWACRACALFVACALIWILGDLVIEGIGHLSWNFLLEAPMDAGRSGGIAPILVVAMAVSLPLGLGVAVWLSEFAPQDHFFSRYTALTLDVLAGVPSIVYGLFGYAFFCLYLGMGFSLMSGGLTLACMVLPIFVRTCESGLRAVNSDWKRGAAALGMSQLAAIWHIVLPAARPAIVAGLILGIGRATAETAALLFTSGYVDRMPESFFDSGRALSVHIYDLSMNVTGGDASAYASALVLVCLILALNFVAQGLVDNWLKRKLVTA